MKRSIALLALFILLLTACTAANPAAVQTSTGPGWTVTPDPIGTTPPTPVPSTATATPEPTLTLTPSESTTPLLAPYTETSAPTFTPLPRTTLTLKNGVTWTECAVADREYGMVRDDFAVLSSCVEPPSGGNAADQKMWSEQVEGPGGFTLHKIIIGKDLYETHLADIDKYGCCHYELTKNGTVSQKVDADMVTYDPDQGLWDIEGKLVWEIGSWTSYIIVNGVNYNDRYHLQGSFKPYEIKGKLIYIAQQNDKFHIVYDNQAVGPEFDEISMPDCCGMMYLFRLNGQYWFVGSRQGQKYLVSIQ